MRKIKIISIIVVIVFLSFLFWLQFLKNSSVGNFKNKTVESKGELVASATISDTPINLDKISERREAPSGFIEYKNGTYGFSFFYPKEAKIQEYNERGGAMTITVQDVATVQGFQIFIVPYSEDKISEDRFRRDVPSGVRTNVKDISVGGVQAVTFLSKDQFLGETLEIWMINKGYLFEMTTLKGSDWFVPIIQTWKF